MLVGLRERFALIDWWNCTASCMLRKNVVVDAQTSATRPLAHTVLPASGSSPRAELLQLPFRGKCIVWRGER